MYPPTIKKLIQLFSKFPGIGEKSATRFVFFLLKEGKGLIEDLSSELLRLKKEIRFCRFCFHPFQSEKKLCNVCEDPTRDRSIVCVIEKEQDVETIEQLGVYRGLYFLIGPTIESLKEENLSKMRIKELIERIKNPEKFGVFAKFKEIILGLNPTFEGDAISHFLEKELKEKIGKIKITHLGRGLPYGGEIEYADKETLRSSFQQRREI